MAQSTVHTGMGAIPHEAGTAFRVWAPHAGAVVVTGDFDGWSGSDHPLADEGDGYWYADVPGAHAGQEYKFRITHEGRTFDRVDPYARQVTNSVGNGIVYDPAAFDWQGDDFACPPHHELVIYETHVGSFVGGPGGSGNLELVAGKLGYLRDLGVNAIELMPLMEFAGDYSWGYNPAHIFAVESGYGGPDALKAFVREAHRHGIAVVLDVVYNHFGPSDLDLWQFDGWSEGDKGGIYFYNDHRAATPWGETRPDYGREAVRRYIHDNAMMWLRDFHLDGLRFDMTPYMRSVDGTGKDIPEGWELMRWIARDAREQFPGRIMIAEDLHGDPAVTSTGDEGACFHAQWDTHFVHPVRRAVIAEHDGDRSMDEVAHAIMFTYGDTFARVVYTESHDEVANGSARVPHEIAATDSSGWAAQKRATLGAALVLTAPGIPMLFQGQEFLEDEWFRDDVPLDWPRGEQFEGVVRLFRDLVSLRRNLQGDSAGLTGRHTRLLHVDDHAKLLVFQRATDHDEHAVVVANLSGRPLEAQQVGMPHAGQWRLRCNSDASTYSALFGGHAAHDLQAHELSDEHDHPAYASVDVGPYTVLVYTPQRDAQ
ncbi:alpha-amylase family glycosyl hydrolase [Ornithinimicrobium sediminis]|uniref:alpha-amylase family glycosyl hydrolase n=1 Tax=Ornithinimicrobium sediminis TaxID=2904603 RepID=UPI001E372F4E|nr:alpha-amylase family glycosyl hydrolase [Ornithinimicrobium sediminis]MCE0487807.1 alpha amylase C-terminal domain-containing protein [Ornithinimicrobium sediminis]